MLFIYTLKEIFLSSFVEADWQSPQADEAVRMLGQDHRIPIQSYLLQVISDVVSVISLAESFSGQVGYVIVLMGNTKQVIYCHFVWNHWFIFSLLPLGWLNVQDNKQIKYAKYTVIVYVHTCRWTTQRLSGSDGMASSSLLPRYKKASLFNFCKYG